jgi:predicted RNase H-like HicB family nuclease
MLPPPNAVVEKDEDTGLFVATIEGVSGAHSQGLTLDEALLNLAEVLDLLADEGALDPQDADRRN